MKKACLDSLAGGPLLVLRLLPALLAAGCVSHSFDVAHVADVRYKPGNIYRRSATLDPRLKRVAVLPITAAASTETFIAGAQLLQPLLFDELINPNSLICAWSRRNNCGNGPARRPGGRMRRCRRTSSTNCAKAAAAMAFSSAS